MTGRGRGRASGPPGPPGPPPGPPGGLRQRPPAPRQPPPPPTRVEPTFVGSGESISSGSASTPSTEMSPPSTVLDITQTGSTVSGSASSSASPEDISPDLSRMQLKDPVKFQGDAGKSFNVTSNYLKIVATPNTGVYEYDVRFNPNVDSRQDRFRLIRQIEPTIGTIRTFDGVKLFLPTLLPSKSTTCPVAGSDIKIIVTYKKKLDLVDREMIQQFNIIFKRIFNVLKFKMHNRNFYDPVSATAIKQHNLSIWPGYVTAVDQYEGGLLLQCDVSHRVLRTETVRDVLTMLRKKGAADLKSAAEKELLGVSVLTKYNNLSYKIDDINWDMNPESTFTNSKGETMSFIDYYKKQYGLDIADRKQPLLINRPTKKGLTEAEADRTICLIPELCMMTGLTDAMRSDFRVMQDVAKITRITPQARRDTIDKFIKRIKGNPEAHKLITDWGMDIDNDTVRLVGRVLPPETLYFANGKSEIIGPKGEWNRAATNSVLTAVSLTKWAIFFPEKNKAIVQNFCKELQRVASRMGIQMANPKVVSLPDDRTDSYIKQMRTLVNQSVQLFMMIFPAQKADRYSAVKKLCCIESPVPSQVVCLKTISNEKRLSAVAQKIALQMNCKLGGELWACRTPLKKLMVVGIDVFHSKSAKAGSIGGMVSSLNDSLSRYYSAVVIQKQGQELIDALKVAFIQSLIRYYEANNNFPDVIVVFRDGVSDSQMDTVAAHEGQQFMNAFKGSTGSSDSSGDSDDLRKKFKELRPEDYSPQFVYIVVKKRISTRIMMPQGKDVANPPPGTVLDNTVTRFAFKDFFLVPQAVNQGTVTPTHMVVTKEEGAPLGPNIIQQLAYKLTHMYFNWPGTVRVPAPCQYAHKLVDLVGEHLHGQPSQELNDKLYFL